MPNIDLAGITYWAAVIPELGGTLNGNGLTISNLTIVGDDRLGLVGTIQGGGRVLSLGVVDANVAGTGDCVGILVGYNDHSADVTHCYSTGTLTGCNGVGGLVGRNEGDVTCCFWDIHSSGRATSAGGTGLTTAQMQIAGTFLAAGWDFVGETENGAEDMWRIHEGRDYPMLVRGLSAFSPDPLDSAVDVVEPLILNWVAGASALYHDIYFGEDEQAIADATTESPHIYRGRQTAEMTTYKPEALELAKTYYWRIDEVKEADPNSPWKGRVWSFTTANYIVVDDFESYTDKVGDRIFQTWIDGYGWTEPPPGHPGNGTGSTVG